MFKGRGTLAFARRIQIWIVPLFMMYLGILSKSFRDRGGYEQVWYKVEGRQV